MTAIHADAHVHLYDCFDLDSLLDAAHARAAWLGGPLLLLLAESQGYARFEALRDSSARTGEARTSGLEPTDEPHALRSGRRGSTAADVALVAGRQKVSADGIEVLALCLDPAHPLCAEPDGALETESLVRAALEAGALAVLPWGFGKWLGARGAKVAEIAAHHELRTHPRFFLGDIPHRCRPWPVPRAFRHGARVLPGTDPLPVRGLERGVGRFALRVDARWDARRPAASLYAALESGAQIAAVGGHDSALSTLAQQLRYRTRRAR